MLEKTKITKKEYFKLIENKIHYNIGSISNKDKTLLEKQLLEIENTKLNDKNTFNNLEFLENNCLKCVGAIQNSIDFIHINSENQKLYENKKGKFYKVIINDILYIYHYYNDNYNTISFKAIRI